MGQRAPVHAECACSEQRPLRKQIFPRIWNRSKDSSLAGGDAELSNQWCIISAAPEHNPYLPAEARTSRENVPNALPSHISPSSSMVLNIITNISIDRDLSACGLVWFGSGRASRKWNSRCWNFTGTVENRDRIFWDRGLTRQRCNYR